MRLLLLPVIGMLLLIATAALAVLGRKDLAMITLLLWILTMYLSIQYHRRATVAVKRIVDQTRARMETEAGEKGKAGSMKKVVKRKIGDIHTKEMAPGETSPPKDDE
ncbi:MAG: hypothetical protein L0Z54_03245 [Thermoplasmata archaeon]|nr:hypothetical protein [Thermoplasmata archaeon]